MAYARDVTGAWGCGTSPSQEVGNLRKLPGGGELSIRRQVLVNPQKEGKSRQRKQNEKRHGGGLDG